jgi:hypothetical protein
MPSARSRLTALFALVYCCLSVGCVPLTPPWSNETDASRSGAGGDSAAAFPRAEVAWRDQAPGEESAADGAEAAAADVPAPGGEVSRGEEDGPALAADSPAAAGGVMGSGGSLTPGTGGAAGAGGLPSANVDGGSDALETGDSSSRSDSTTSDGSADAGGVDGAAGLVLIKLTGAAFGTSPAYSGNPTATYDKAFDGDVTTFFDDSVDSGGYTGMDLGSGRTSMVRAIRFYPRKDFNDRMAGGKFQCSVSSQTDGYVDLYTITVEPPLAWTEVSVANSPACRFLRYVGPTGSYTDVAEIEFWALDAPEAGAGHLDAGAALTNLALGKPAQASSEQTSAGKTADQGNDGLLSTSFCPASGDFPAWYLVDLGASYPVRQTDVTVETSYATYQYRIEVSADGSSWTTVADHQADAVFGPPTLSDNFQAQARYVRVTILGVSGSYWGCIREFSVWGFDTPSTAAGGP